MYNGKQKALFIALLVSSTMAMAQDTAMNAEKNDVMRSNNKIYVVMVIVLTILAGLLLYLVRLEKKIGKLENKDIA